MMIFPLIFHVMSSISAISVLVTDESLGFKITGIVLLLYSMRALEYIIMTIIKHGWNASDSSIEDAWKAQ